MLIRTKRPWFTPDTSGTTSLKYVGKNQRPTTRGSLLPTGEHEVPDEWKSILPSDAVVIDDYSEDEPEEDLHAASFVHQPLSIEAITAKAEGEKAAELKLQRQANIAKARGAKKEKAANA